MTFHERKIVAFVASEGFEGCFPLFQTLAWANQVELVKGHPDLLQKVSGFIYMEPTGNNYITFRLPSGLPSFRIKLVSQVQSNAEISFSQSTKLPKLLRGRKVVAVQGLPIGSGLLEGEILAEVRRVPVWTTRLENGVRHDVNIQVAPWVAGEDRLFQHLNGQNFMRLLPLIEWMRAISDWGKWEKPPVRASFMFDDPYLHTSSYGFISFTQLAEEGKMNDFHTGLAMVPLDTYYANGRAVRIFRDNKKVLSLLFHGNNHVFRELAGDGTEDDCYSLVIEALTRIKSLEKRTGLKVDKVMAPPHGAFGVRMMRVCASLGFEAACVTWGSIWSSNKDHYWTRLLGAEPSRVIEGLPVIPRMRMAMEAKNQILLSAYLGQPVVLVGHHWDIANGFDILRELAAFINGLGDVRWGSTAEIARSNFWWCLEGETLIVKPFSRLMEFFVPENVREIIICEDWLKHEVKVTAQGVNSTEQRSFLCEKDVANTWRISVNKPCKIKVEAKVENETDNGESEQIKYSLKPLVRRFICEGRDRLMAYMPHGLWKKLV